MAPLGRISSQKQIVAQLDNSFPSYDISRNFITLFTGDGQWHCGETKWFSVHPNTIVISDVLSRRLRLGLSNCFFHSDIPVKSSIVYPYCYACYKTRSPGYLLFDHTSDKIFGDQKFRVSHYAYLCCLLLLPVS
jgi:hypothetical protein